MPRTDGLPPPVSITDEYLAAVLDELRAMRRGQEAPVVSVAVEPPPEIHVREPEVQPETHYEEEVDPPTRLRPTRKRR